MGSINTDGTLRASEFAVILNGDNYQNILNALKQFARTVRKERRFALALDDDDDGDWLDNERTEAVDEENDKGTKEPLSKKYKKSEEWKKDTASYDVPFVGTAVARREQAEVVKGEWPTGFVKVYLEKSPVALELLNADLLAPDGMIHKALIKKNRTKLSRSICKAHLLAIAELFTVAIPPYKLQTCSSSDNYNKVGDSEPTKATNINFLHKFTQVYLPQLFDILNEETERGRGKFGAVGGCDLLVAPVLKILKYFSMISTSNARLIARYLDEKLLEGVLRVCLRPLHIKKEMLSQSPNETMAYSKPPRIEAILLATSLLHTKDPAVNTYICTRGSKERKVKPGILYTALREGLAASSHSANKMDDKEDKYNGIVADMLECIRLFLFTTSNIAAPRLLYNLVTRDPLQHLCRLSSYAPPLTRSSTYVDVLNARDIHSELGTVLENLGIEARLLLFPLLSSRAISPFLLGSSGDQIARSMVRLLESRNACIELRRFLLYCTNEAPFLVDELFRLLTMPDPRNSFGFISRTSFIASVLRKGPSAITCVASMVGEKQITTEDVLPTFLPTKIKGQFLAKSLQNGNHFVILESFKLIIVVLERFRLLRSEGTKRYKWDDTFVENLTLATFHWLPDFKILLSLRSRFDGMSTSRCGAILTNYLFQVIEAYITTMPSIVDRVNFDWMKLFPDSASIYNQAHLLIQVRILKCLQIIIKICQHDLDSLLLSSKIIFEIMLSTKSKRIHGMCQKIATSLMTNALLPRVTNDNTTVCIQEEASTWIDAVSPSTLSTFFKLLQEVLNNSWTQLVLVGKASKIYCVPNNLNCSLLVAATLSCTSDSSESFALLVGQVLSRCLANLRDPLSLAAVIIYANTQESSIAKGRILVPLVNYAQAILDFIKEDNKSRMSHLRNLLSSYFENGSHYSCIPNFLNGFKSIDMVNAVDINSLLNLSPMRLISFIKFLSHTFVFLGVDGTVKERYWIIIQKLLPTVLLHSMSTTVERKLALVLGDTYSIQKHRPCMNFDEIDIMVLSCPFATSNEFIRRIEKNKADTLFKSRNEIFLSTEHISQLLRVSLLKNHLPPNSFEKIQLSLISDMKNRSSSIGLQFLVCCFGIRAQRFDEDYAFEYFVLETAINAWLWVAKEAKYKKSLLYRQIKSSLCALLVHSMKKETIKAATLLMLIDKHPESLILELCVDFSIVDDKSGALAEIEFLNILLRIDSYRFLRPLLSYLRNMSARLSKAWQRGYLDTSVEILMRQIKSSPEMLDSFFEVLTPIASQRLIQTLSTIETPVLLDKILPLMNLVCRIFDLGNTTSCDIASLTKEVVRILSIFRKIRNIQSYGHGIKELCCVGMCILSYLKVTNTYENSDQITKQLTSELFHFFFAALPLILKQNSSQLPIGFPPDILLTWLITLIEDFGNFDPLMLRQMEASVAKRVCRACLKHGVSVGNDIDHVPTLSLHLMGLLMIQSSDGESCLAPIIPPARDVFFMITSHSKFEKLFTDTENYEEDIKRTKTKEAVLRLMISCVIVSIDDIEIELSTWRIIFTTSNAGLSRFDILIRNLISVCSRNSIPFMDEFRWKGCEMPDQELLLTRRFDWLIDALDMTRIRATVSKFPYSDRLNQDIPLDNIWAKQELHDVDENPTKSYQLTTQSETDGEIGSVDRYSLAFVLPLLLEGIKFGLNSNKKIDADGSPPRNTSRESEDLESMPPWNFSKSSIVSIHRLCEKGVTSLCLVSLSSLCEKIRCYAVSILGLILQACNTSEALESSSWRDRPQLVMILNSVQRSLVLQKSLEVDSAVPKVTPIVANFLARAALVLPRPDDALYVPINRYFLKSEADHGAFQDTNRLPGFMSLFCSSSEDSNQSRAERMWGLQMLCDGLVDASCYKLATSCHAPEMILSSFENVRLSHSSDEAKGAEICLLLESLKSMIDHGEFGALVHLVRRCGIVSWMSSLCTNRPLDTTFPTERARISFCKLARSVVEMTFSTPQLKSSNVVDEMCALIQPLLYLCLIKRDTDQFSHDLYKASFAVLQSISIGLSSVRDEGLPCPNVQPMGASIEISFCVLKIADDSMKEISLQTLCSLPISLTVDYQQETAHNLILLSLHYFDIISKKADRTSSLSTMKKEDKLIRLVLQRSALLIERYEIQSMPTASIVTEIIRKVYVLRCDSRISEIEVRALWSRCLRLLIQNTSRSDKSMNFLEGEVLEELYEDKISN